MTRRADHEGPVHRAVLQYLRHVLPGAIIHHSANEGVRGGKDGWLDGAFRKGMGQVPGYPDIVIHLRGETLFVEVKAPGGTLSLAQKVLHERLMGLGYRVAVVRSIDDVRERLAGWGVATKEAGAKA